MIRVLAAVILASCATPLTVECTLILPADEGQDMAHGDWVRNGFNDMINQWRDAVW